MLRIGLRLLLAAVILMAIGWISLAHVLFEIVRNAGIACLTLGMILLIVDYIRTGEP